MTDMIDSAEGTDQIARKKCHSQPSLQSNDGCALWNQPLDGEFVAHSINVGEGLVKLSHVVGRTWTYGGVAHSFCTAVKRLS